LVIEVPQCQSRPLDEELASAANRKKLAVIIRVYDPAMHPNGVSYIGVMFF